MYIYIYQVTPFCALLIDESRRFGEFFLLVPTFLSFKFLIPLSLLFLCLLLPLVSHLLFPCPRQPICMHTSSMDPRSQQSMLYYTFVFLSFYITSVVV